jgi:hypothetical protein
MLRELGSDVSLGLQREKMQNEIRAAERSPESLLQKSKLESDLKHAGRNPDRAEQAKRQQGDIEQARETFPKKAQR